jgi:radical SAM-linked protein
VQETGAAAESPAVPRDAMPVAVPTPSGHPVCKIHFALQKVGELRFLSHLELMRALARALRRASIPVAYTQGFNPQPRLALAQALAVGVAGESELGELDLAEPVPPSDLVARWNARLAPELKILRAWEAPLHGPSLSAGVRGAVYRIQLSPSGGEVSLPAGLGESGACAAFLAQPHIPVEVSKKGIPTTLDARPFLQEFSVLGQNGALSWEMRLKAGPEGSVKPSAVMRSFLGGRVAPAMLDHLHASLRITRTALALEGQG